MDGLPTAFLLSSLNAMSSRRALKVAEAIREVVSTAILIDLKDPRVQGVTVTHVEASGDLRYAKVHVSVMGDETRQQLSLRGLQHAAGYLQSKVGDRLEMRYTPRLTFLLDQRRSRSKWPGSYARFFPGLRRPTRDLRQAASTGRSPSRT